MSVLWGESNICEKLFGGSLLSKREILPCQLQSVLCSCYSTITEPPFIIVIQLCHLVDTVKKKKKHGPNRKNRLLCLRETLLTLRTTYWDTSIVTSLRWEVSTELWAGFPVTNTKRSSSIHVHMLWSSLGPLCSSLGGSSCMHAGWNIHRRRG